MMNVIGTPVQFTIPDFPKLQQPNEFKSLDEAQSAIKNFQDSFSTWLGTLNNAAASFNQQLTKTLVNGGNSGILQEVSSNPNPTDGYGKMFVQDNKLYFMNGVGTNTCLTP